jgi:hypothetical protein
MKRLRIKTMLMAFVLVVAAVACTHLPRPQEKYSRGTAYLDWGRDEPDARDLARHTIEGKRPFEWWYFDGHLDTGETFVAVFHDPSFTNGKPGVTFSLYDPDWKKTSIMKALKPGELKSSTEDVDIICPQGFVRRLDEKNYHLHWDAQGISADFKLVTVAPGWMPGGKDGANREAFDFFWNVHQGRNHIEGTITRNGRTDKVRGTGYADHNWGRKPLYEIARYWVWGRVFSGEYTFIFADVDHIDSRVTSRPLYVAKGDKMIIGTGSPTIRQSGFVTHPVLKRHYPTKIRIDFAEADVQATLEITFRSLVEDVDLLEATGFSRPAKWIAKTFFARPVYFRATADYRGSVTYGGETELIRGECLYEIMGFE